MARFYLALQSLLIPILLPCFAAQRVSTTNGDIVGTTVDVRGDMVDTYYGIPFAKPPIDNLRFKHPVAAESWSPEVKNTTEKKASCYQTAYNDFGMPWRNGPPLVSEDCLYINAWVPTGLKANGTLSTMVWIYGGSFVSGSINGYLYDGRYLAAAQNVIVMSINYRIGAHGFLYLSPETFPGNQGMMDQVLGMEWIYKNVERFGGDKNSITLFGESAGAASIGLHLLSPLSRNFFNRAILESGVANVDWAALSPDLSERAAIQLADLCGCSNKSKSEMYICLREVDPATIVEKQGSISFPYAPVVDGLFLPDFPATLVRSGQIKQADILLGTNKNEGTVFLLGMFPTVFIPLNTITVTKKQFDQEVVSKLFRGRASPADNAAYAQYVDTKVVSDRDYIQISGDVNGDKEFVCPTIYFADSVAKINQNSVYMYSFQHRLSSLTFPLWMGTSHGFELEFVFGLYLLDGSGTYTADEELLSLQIQAYWAQFAKTGNPNMPGQMSQTWPKYDLDNEKYLVLDLPEKMSVRQGLRKQECVFWNSIVPLMLENKSGMTTETPVCISSASHTMISIALLLSIIASICTWA